MSDAKHTPGPWAYERATGEVYYADGDVYPHIATINPDGTTIEQCDADGYLIAAAPELLAAIRRLLSYAEVYADVNEFAPANGIIKEARAAIAKAEAGGRFDYGYPPKTDRN